jgi:hypothetical protein
MVKLPRPPSVAFLRDLGPDLHVLPAGSKLWRIHFLGGDYPADWDSFRFYGPVQRGRFDHHLSPPRLQSRGILYAAVDAVTCLAEVFQETRVINTRRDDPWLVSFVLREEVILHNLTGGWPTRAGASMAINTGSRTQVQLWSQAIYNAYPEVDGVYYCSSMNQNRPAVALYERGRKALPASPSFHRALKDSTLFIPLCNAAHDLRYRIV